MSPGRAGRLRAEHYRLVSVDWSDGAVVGTGRGRAASARAVPWSIVTAMYEAFYGLKERPFELVPNPRFLFLDRAPARSAEQPAVRADDRARLDADDRRSRHRQDDADAGGPG